MPKDKINQQICNNSVTYIDWRRHNLEEYFPEEFITYDICRFFINVGGNNSIYRVPIKFMTKKLYDYIKFLMEKKWFSTEIDNFEEYIKKNNILF